MPRAALFLLLLVPASLTAAHLRRDPSHEAVARSLPGSWSHPLNHPSAALFKRAPRLSQRDSAAAGSPEWVAQYPKAGQNPMDESLTPQHWLDALAAAEQAGKIPNIPASSPNSAGSPQYPSGVDPTSPQVCSATWKCRQPDDIWDGPDGYVGIGFDDGPSYGSAKLYDFLQSQHLAATHFMIGTNIVYSTDLFFRAYRDMQDDIASHTWTHPYMTTLNNTQLVAQLGWTQQIIHDLTGRVPRFWRPPYGDSDNRVRAIAKEVFGLVQVNWNQDSEDWTMATPGGPSLNDVQGHIQGWYAGSQSPGLIILEHELSDNTSQAFISTFPDLQSHNWKTASTLQLPFAQSEPAPYQNDASGSMDIVTAASSASSAAASSSASEDVGPQASAGVFAGAPQAQQHSANNGSSPAHKNAAPRSRGGVRSGAGIALAIGVMLLVTMV